MGPKTVLDHMGFAVRDYDRSKALYERHDASLGFDSSRYVRPKRRANSSTLGRECVDGGPLSSVMAYRAPCDAR